jgi:hypothetical protein
VKRLLIFVLLLAGCSAHKPAQKPKPPSQIVSGIPSIATGELRIDGDRVMAAGLYDLLVNADYYTPTKIDQVMRDYKAAGCNLFRVWVKTYFRPTDWHPWKRDLAVPNEDFYNRMKMIAGKADAHGICIAWVLIDFWSIRQGFGYPPIEPDILCPTKHVDPLAGTEQAMMTMSGYFDEHGGFYMNGAPRARRVYKINYGTGEPLGCRDHPAWWEMFRRAVTIAEQHKDIVYIASEMCSGDKPHDEWDNQAMVIYTQLVRDFVKNIYPGAIIGTSVNDINSECYDHVDIADIHGLGYGVNCDPWDLQKGPVPGIVCYNSDGCMAADRYNPDWIAAAVRNAWAVGGFFETKADSGAPIENILEGFRRASK